MIEKDLIETLEIRYNMAKSMIDYNIRRESDPVLLNGKIQEIKNIFFNDIKDLIDKYHTNKEQEIADYESYLYQEDSE